MIQLNLNNPFKFTFVDGTESKELSGSMRELTKQEQAEFRKLHEDIEAKSKKGQALVSKITRNNKLISIKEKTEDFKGLEKLLIENNKLEDELQVLTESFDTTKDHLGVLKSRFEICLSGDDKDEIIDIAEAHGYDVVFEVIAQAIREGKTEE